MTTKEKAKAYDEALERARKIHSWIINNELLGFPGQIEDIFPQLRESEDERVRKEIIDFIQWAEDRHFMREDFHQAKRPSEWIAYLEKQKDSKWSPSEDEMGVLYKLCYISNQVTDEDDTELTRLYQDLKREYFNGHSFENMFPSEKQKEQKPEWSEEDENMLNRIIETLSLPPIYDTKACARMVSWLKSLRPVKQEWSEEDENALKYLHELISFGFTEKFFDAQTAADMREWLNTRLKSLRPQPKQEWQIKKGDKVSIHCRKDREKDIIAIYDGKVGKVTHVSDKRYPWGHIDVKLDNGCNNSFHEDEIEVLDKSHWKPTEEQMTAILRAEGVLRLHGQEEVAKRLAEIYEQLKKRIRYESRYSR